MGLLFGLQLPADVQAVASRGGGGVGMLFKKKNVFCVAEQPGFCREFHVALTKAQHNELVQAACDIYGCHITVWSFNALSGRHDFGGRVQRRSGSAPGWAREGMNLIFDTAL